jgi:hypothetical protein
VGRWFAAAETCTEVVTLGMEVPLMLVVFITQMPRTSENLATFALTVARPPPQHTAHCWSNDWWIRPELRLQIRYCAHCIIRTIPSASILQDTGRWLLGSWAFELSYRGDMNPKTRISRLQAATTIVNRGRKTIPVLRFLNSFSSLSSPP